MACSNSLCERRINEYETSYADGRAKLPAIWFKACEAQAKNLAARHYYYTQKPLGMQAFLMFLVKKFLQIDARKKDQMK